MSKINCSVPILTCNSERYLVQCLESLRDFQDVFLVDGRSTDRTHDIARQFNIPIYFQHEGAETQKIKDFSEMRTKSMQYASTDWIFYLDSDEYITPALAEEIRLFCSLDTCKKVAMIQKKLVIGTRVVHHAFNYPNYGPRIFHKHSGVLWKKGKKVHEQLHIPEDVKTQIFVHPFFSYTESSYREFIVKDTYYTSLFFKKIQQSSHQSVSNRIGYAKSSVLYILRACHVVINSIALYVRYGFSSTLPILHVYRYVRYNLIIAWFRFLQVFRLF